MYRRAGFTLIELSIVLVIIGLIVGGILVGQNLIQAAEVRAQLSQIEKYQAAVNTFRGKFTELPGDMTPGNVNKYGFPATTCSGTQQGFRNGDGLLDGWMAPFTLVQAKNETVLFWQDISASSAGNLIEGTFPNSGGAIQDCAIGLNLTTTVGSTYLGDYFPAAKIGYGNYVYVYETAAHNWFGLTQATSTNSSGDIFGTPSIPVAEAYSMDKKVDDGLPQSGTVLATYDNTANWSLAIPTNAPNGPNDTTSTCYNTANNLYSLSSYANYGSGGNCALSFRFQ